ncbi:MAG: radical SAM protein [Candidatus Jordarchaeaceae archaeon]
MSTRTLLINTPYPFTECPTIPLGLTYLAAVLEDRGFDVDILDMVVYKFSREKIIEKIREYKPDIVGAGSVTMNYPHAKRILQIAKSEGATTIIGGPHATFADREVLSEAPWIDMVVRREGEYTLLDIVRGRDLKDVKGITYREDGEIVRNPDRELLMNLDELPFPARHLIPLSKYIAYKTGCSMVTGRGCPNRCIFCVGPKMTSRKMRFRNPKLCVDEMEEILNYGFEEIIVEDDTFTINKNHVFSICDEIISRGLKFKWSANARVNTVTKEMLEKMYEAGCIFIQFGVESGNPEILKTCKKGITLEQVRKATQIAKEVGIGVLSSFIIGLPGETKETIRETMEFAKSLGTYYGYHVLAPFPGTEVRERADELGVKILTNNWLRYDANRAVTETEGVSAEYMNKIVRDFYKGVTKYVKNQVKAEEAGTASEADLKDVAIRRRRSLAWHLLKNDLIETYGKFKDEADNPVKRLADNLYSYRGIQNNFTKQYIEKEIAQMVKEKLLTYKNENGIIVWQWKMPEKPRKTKTKEESTIPTKTPTP